MGLEFTNYFILPSMSHKECFLVQVAYYFEKCLTYDTLILIMHYNKVQSFCSQTIYFKKTTNNNLANNFVNQKRSS